jgi:hypothetical protein
MKTFGIVLLSFLLFILLAVFGFAFSVNQIALSPGFVTGVINDIDFSQTTRDAIEYQQTPYPDENSPQELVDAIIDTVDEIEPVIKEKTNIAVRDMYDYVLGKANAPDLKETLGNSFMNTQFVDSILVKIDLSRIVDEAMKAQTTPSGGTEDAFQESFLAALDKLEPTLKKGVVATSDPVFKYLLGNTQTINLKSITRQNIINKEFVTEMTNAMDVKLITKDLIGDQLDMLLPQGIRLNSGEVDQVIAAIEPAIKTGMISSADPIADYLLGIRPSFNLTIPWDTTSISTKAIVKQAFLRQLPPELAGATPAQIDQAYEIYWASAQNSIPKSFYLNADILGEDVSQSISDVLTSAQNGLADARDGINEASTSMAKARNEVRPYITLSRFIFWSLILVILLIIGGLILIHRSVRGATLNLGIVFLVYGAIELIGVLIIRSIIGGPAFIQRFVDGDIPEYVFNIISPIMQRLTQPLFIFTLACTIIGIALLVVFFVYSKKQPNMETSQPPSQLS